MALGPGRIGSGGASVVGAYLVATGVGIVRARVRFDGGWGLLEASNTQPVIVAPSEAETEEQLTAIRDEIESWLRTREVAI